MTFNNETTSSHPSVEDRDGDGIDKQELVKSPRLACSRLKMDEIIMVKHWGHK